MAEDWYSIEEDVKERGRQKEKIQSKVQKHPLKHSQLLKTLKINAGVSVRNLKEIGKKKYPNPVISLYIRFDSEKTLRVPKVYLTFFNSLKHKEINSRKEYISNLSHLQKEIFERDLREIEDLLRKHLDTDHVGSLIIFKSGGELNVAFKIPLKTVDLFTISNKPSIKPLENILKENEKILIVRLTKKEAELSSYWLGTEKKLKTIKSFVPNDNVDAGIPGKNQRHRLMHLENHVKKAASAAKDCFYGQFCHLIILIGDGSIIPLFEKHADETLKRKIIARMNFSHHQNREEEIKQWQAAIQDYRKIETG